MRQGRAGHDSLLFPATGIERESAHGHRAGKWCGKPWGYSQYVSYSVSYDFLFSGDTTGPSKYTGQAELGAQAMGS